MKTFTIDDLGKNNWANTHLEICSSKEYRPTIEFTHHGDAISFLFTNRRKICAVIDALQRALDEQQGDLQ